MARFDPSDTEWAIGRCRGGLSPKIHTVVDARGLPIRLLPAPGQTSEKAVVANRCGKRARNYRAAIALASTIALASIRLWLRHHKSTT